jgi:hypothetical protein
MRDLALAFLGFMCFIAFKWHSIVADIISLRHTRHLAWNATIPIIKLFLRSLKWRAVLYRYRESPTSRIESPTRNLLKFA